MAATATAGSGKTLIIQQSASEQAVYTISAAAIMADGFSIDAILLDVQAAAGGATIAIENNGTTVLVSSSASAAAAGGFVLPLTLTSSVLDVAASSNLVITTAGANSQSRITLVLSELSGRSVVVS
jgi:hypothetical protein